MKPISVKYDLHFSKSADVFVKNILASAFPVMKSVEKILVSCKTVFASRILVVVIINFLKCSNNGLRIIYLELLELCIHDVCTSGFRSSPSPQHSSKIPPSFSIFSHSKKFAGHQAAVYEKQLTSALNTETSLS